MPSHSEGPGIWLSVWRFLLTHCLYERAAKVLARLRGCAGSPEPSLLASAISTKFAWRGPFNDWWICFTCCSICNCLERYRLHTPCHTTRHCRDMTENCWKEHKTWFRAASYFFLRFYSPFNAIKVMLSLSLNLLTLFLGRRRLLSG